MTPGQMRAVILAGGKGTRLAPYTTVLPKPLMPVGEMPILELLIHRLRAAGVQHVTLAVGHLSALIMAYFGDGARFGVSIDYSLEEQALGTAAPLRLLEGLDAPFFVMNGDLLTDIDFTSLARRHAERPDTAATVGVYRKQVRIDLGVIKTVEDGRLQAYIEKPSYDFLVSMGVYVLTPDALDAIPPHGAFDLPDLVTSLVGAGTTVSTYEHPGYWLDIGRPEDYARAQEDAAAGRLAPTTDRSTGS